MVENCAGFMVSWSYDHLSFHQLTNGKSRIEYRRHKFSKWTHSFGNHDNHTNCRQVIILEKDQRSGSLTPHALEKISVFTQKSSPLNLKPRLMLWVTSGKVIFFLNLFSFGLWCKIMAWPLKRKKSPISEKYGVFVFHD